MIVAFLTDDEFAPLLPTRGRILVDRDRASDEMRNLVEKLAPAHTAALSPPTDDGEFDYALAALGDAATIDAAVAGAERVKPSGVLVFVAPSSASGPSADFDAVFAMSRRSDWSVVLATVGDFAAAVLSREMFTAYYRDRFRSVCAANGRSFVTVDDLTSVTLDRAGGLRVSPPPRFADAPADEVYAAVVIGADPRAALPAARAGGRVLIVEPVAARCAALKAAHRDDPQVVVAQAAIGPADRDDAAFFFCAAPDDPGGVDDRIGSLSRDHAAALAAPTDAAVQETLVPMRTLRSLFDAYQVRAVDHLILSAGGTDAEALCRFDFAQPLVGVIDFDHRHTDGAFNASYAHARLRHHLASCGYRTKRLDDRYDRATLRPDWRAARAATAARLSAFDALRSREVAGFAHRPPPSSGGRDAGVVYLALGPAAFDDCAMSLATLRRFNPMLPVTIFTDQAIHGPLAAEIVALAPTKSPFKHKVDLFAASPYEKSLFIDADTFVVGELSPLFAALDDVDVAVAPSPEIRFFGGGVQCVGLGGRTGFNTGVFAFRRTSAFNAFQARWAELVGARDDAMIAAGRFCDQWAFNSLVAQDGAAATFAMTSLDPALWNLRPYILPMLKRRGVSIAPRVLHGRFWEFEQFGGVDLTTLLAGLFDGQGAAR